MQASFNKMLKSSLENTEPFNSINSFLKDSSCFFKFVEDKSGLSKITASNLLISPPG